MGGRWPGEEVVVGGEQVVGGCCWVLDVGRYYDLLLNRYWIGGMR
jgi:hypothetical protein